MTDYLHDIFLSYSNQPPFRDWVRDSFRPLFQGYLTDALQHKANVFFDRDGIAPGEAWPERLKKALAASRCLVTVWTGMYFQSDWCWYECSLMLHREQQLGYRTVTNPAGLIFPVVASDGDSLPSHVSTIQHIDLSKFARVGAGFARTTRYIKFQDVLGEWVPKVAAAVKAAPPWCHDWLAQDWLDEAVRRFPKPADPPFPPPSLV